MLYSTSFCHKKSIASLLFLRGILYATCPGVLTRVSLRGQPVFEAMVSLPKTSFYGLFLGYSIFCSNRISLVCINIVSKIIQQIKQRLETVNEKQKVED